MAKVMANPINKTCQGCGSQGVAASWRCCDNVTDGACVKAETVLAGGAGVAVVVVAAAAIVEHPLRPFSFSKR